MHRREVQNEPLINNKYTNNKLSNKGEDRIEESKEELRSIGDLTAEVERQLNIRHENIARACKNNWTAGGYHWQYYIAA